MVDLGFWKVGFKTECYVYRDVRKASANRRLHPFNGSMQHKEVRLGLIGAIGCHVLNDHEHQRYTLLAAWCKLLIT